MMVILSFLLFSAAAAVALATIAGTLASSAPRIAQVARFAMGQPDGLPPLPPRRAAARRATVTRLASTEAARAAA